MVCKMAIVLLPPFFFQSRTNNCKGDGGWYCQLDKTLSDDLAQRIQGVVRDECDVCECVLIETDRRLGRERETSFANIFGPQIQIAMLLTQSSNAACFSVETDCVFAASTHVSIQAVNFPWLSLINNSSSASASSFPHHLWAGPAPPFNA